MRAVALIPAAGQGRRMGAAKPKAFLSLGSIPILAHTLQKFEACSQVDEVLPLVPPGEGTIWAEEIVSRCGLKKVVQILPGGEERQESVYVGLKAIQGRADWVVIHDGVRPFISPELIGRTLAEARTWKAVVVALPANETLKEVSTGKEVLRTIDRRPLWMVQTPQSFEFNLIFGAHEKARKDGFLATDDSSLVERLGIPVKVIEGSRFNFKITTQEDLALGEALLERWKGRGMRTED